MPLDLAVNRESDAYLDFVVALKATSNRNLQVKVQAEYKSLAQQQGIEPTTLEEVAELVEPLTNYKFNRMLTRKAQEMMWSGIANAYKGRENDLVTELDSSEVASLGRLELDPNLKLPAYYETFEFHIQPNSYFYNPLSGIIYHMGQQVYNLRTNNKAKNQLGVARAFLTPLTPEPKQVRVLVMGCGFGTTTWPFCELYPEAEIWGIDLSAPGLKVGYKKAQMLGYKVNFSQQNAEATKFESGYFDMILAHSLFHELPKLSARNAINEAYRLLRDGGTFIISDITPYRELSPWMQFVTDWQVAHNGEPFWRSTLRELHLPTLFMEAGFAQVNERALNPDNPAVKFPWLTIGKKHE